MKTILVPTDFSKNAYHAAMFASILCKNLNTKIVFLNVFSIQIVTENQLEFMVDNEIISKKTKVELETQGFINEFISESKMEESSISYRTEHGIPKEKIIEIAHEIKSDFIIMGTKGANNMLDRWLGTTAQAVMKLAECPVWIIPEKAVLELPKTIMYAADYQEDEFATTHKLLEITKALNATCKVVHIHEYHELKIGVEAKYMAEDLKTEFENDDVAFKNFNRQEIVTGLENYVKTSKPDIMALAIYEKSFFSRIFDTSVTKHFAQNTNIPLLTFKKVMMS